MTTPTNKPIPSPDPQDFRFNVEKVDEGVNSSKNYYIDRFGVKRFTSEGLNNLYQNKLLSMGWQEMGDFIAGLLIENRSQVVFFDGSWYQYVGTLPHTTTTNDPNTDGGIYSITNPAGKWVNMGTDLTLRSDLASDQINEGDKLITVKQPFTGSVSRTQHDKNAETVSVTDFGAVAGVDCSAAIIAALASSAGNILIPDGNFIATPSLTQIQIVCGLLSRIKIIGNFVINAPAGVATFTQPILISAEGGENLSIKGFSNIPITITGQSSVSGSAGDYSVVLSVNSVVGVVVGDYLHCNASIGTGASDIHRGAWKITAVGSGLITVRNTCQLTSFPANTITSSSSRIIKSVFRFIGCDGIVVKSAVLGELSDVVLEGNSDDYWSSINISGTERGTHGIIVGANTIAINGKTDSANLIGVTGGSVSCGKFVGINGFDQQGVVTELGGNFWGDFVASCNNKRRGFYASTASGIRAKQISANGNYLDGVICDLSGSIYASSTSAAIGNGRSGVSASQNGAIIFDSGSASYNKTHGLNVVAGGFVQITNGYLLGNISSGVVVNYSATVYTDNSTISGNGVYGIYLETGATARSPNCTIGNNSIAGIRASYGSLIVYTGSVLSSNGTDLIATFGSFLIDGSSVFGGDLVGSDLKINNLTTKKGVRISTTSGGDNLIMSHDVTGTGTWVQSYNFRSDSQGIYPNNDSVVNFGRSSNRWNVGYFSGGTQSSSDARLKTVPREMNQNELRAAKRIAQMIGFWTWKDDNNQRLRAGTTVQDVIKILDDEGLNWREYGFIGYDKWDDEYRNVTKELDDGTIIETDEIDLVRAAGDLYQFRDQEFDRFIMRGLSERLSELENK